MSQDLDTSVENKIIEIDEGIEVIRCNAYRIDISGNHLIMNFAKARPIENGINEINVMAKIAIPLNELYLSYLFDLYEKGRLYEEEAGVLLLPVEEDEPDE